MYGTTPSFPIPILKIGKSSSDEEAEAEAIPNTTQQEDTMEPEDFLFEAQLQAHDNM
ncbi:hypothetical protein L7F22_000132, partial [Adiantum nelumboides]|nr:hypothetical protein [Adiantum nelumboides]